MLSVSHGFHKGLVFSLWPGVSFLRWCDKHVNQWFRWFACATALPYHIYTHGVIIESSHPRFVLLFVSQAGGAAADGLRVTIDASGPIIGGGVVHAVAVSQPVQSWVVLRNQNDFLQVEIALSQIPGIPACPRPRNDVTDVNDIVAVRNEMQAWLNTILSHPGARESPTVRDFLVQDANMIPPHYDEGRVAWVKFPSAPQEPLIASPASADGDAVEMEMEEMFGDSNYDAPPHDEDAEDDDEIVPASERYQKTEEAVTAEDEMELAGEVEMVDDVGSLAQSMGASHLGRSLQLQAQMGHPAASHRGANAVSGLRLGGAASPGGTPAAARRNWKCNSKCWTSRSDASRTRTGDGISAETRFIHVAQSYRKGVVRYVSQFVSVN